MWTEFKLALLIGLAALIAYGVWYATSDHYQKIIAERQAELSAAELKAATAQAEKIKTAEEQHAKDQLAINGLTAQLAGVHIHFPTCMPTGKASTDTGGGAGALPEGVDGLFADLQARTGRLIQRCDQLNVDARQLNTTLGSKE